MVHFVQSVTWFQTLFCLRTQLLKKHTSLLKTYPAAPAERSASAFFPAPLALRWSDGKEGTSSSYIFHLGLTRSCNSCCFFGHIRENKHWLDANIHSWATSVWNFTKYIVFIHKLCVCVCVCVHMNATVHCVVVRGQLLGVTSLLWACDSRDQTQVTRLGDKILYLISLLVQLEFFPETLAPLSPSTTRKQSL